MIDVAIPGFGRLALTNLVCDFNGSLACDGRLLDDARALLPQVAHLVKVHVVTGNTFGSAEAQLRELPCTLTLLDPRHQAHAKLGIVERLGRDHVVAIGNGRNDRMMMRAAALGIGVVGDEGAAREALDGCAIVVRDIASALGLLLAPQRLIATLRG
jgi:soluble P-type ATPase